MRTSYAAGVSDVLDPHPRLALLHLRTSRRHAPWFQEKLDVLNDATVRVAERLGWRVEPVASAEAGVEATLATVDRADAVVLMGGEDVDPRTYGGPLDYPGSGMHEPLADEAHLAAVRRCVEAGTPLLGLCRGLQLVNVALGGTLVAHLPTVSGHRHPDDFVRNRVRLVGTALEGDVDAEQDVRCTHHQAVDRLGDGLVVAALAGDGVVEAAVHETAPVTGVQWHPEHPDTADDQLAALLERLRRQAAEATTLSVAG